MQTSYQKQIFLALLWILVDIGGTKQQDDDMVWRFFQSVNYVDVATYTDALAREVDNVMTKLRCSSLCVEYGCGCVSFTFDDVSGICHMFTKALVSGGGTSVGANKVTECSVPVVFANATLVNYTGCNATYECNFGYNATASGMLTCQSNETWIPSEFECVEIPCSAPPTLAKGISAVTSLQVGAVAVYTCIQGYINRGGHTNTLNCVVGGTWAGLIDMLCKPVNVLYTFMWTTANEAYAGTGAKVYVTTFGTYGSIKTFLPTTKVYNLGTSDSYDTTQEDVGPLHMILVGHDNTGYNPGWKLESLTITMEGVGSFYFDANVWIDDSQQEVVLYP